jgi:hypothetical protein
LNAHFLPTDLHQCVARCSSPSTSIFPAPFRYIASPLRLPENVLTCQGYWESTLFYMFGCVMLYR